MKLAVVAAVMAALLISRSAALKPGRGSRWRPRSIGRRIVLVRLSGAVAAATLVAIVDYVYQRFSFMKQMRMTRQELRDELKQSGWRPTDQVAHPPLAARASEKKDDGRGAGSNGGDYQPHPLCRRPRL